MDIFLDCLFNNDLKKLVISGNPTELQLTEIWVAILSEYYELRNGTASDLWIMQRDIIRTQNNLYLTSICIDFLKDTYSEKILSSLKSLGYMFPNCEFKSDEYYQALEIIVNKSKTKFIYLQQLIQQYTEKLTNSTSKSATRDDFETLLIEIESMQHMSYDFSVITVSKFVQLEKKLMKVIERQKSKL